MSLSQDTRIMYSTYHINHNISHLSYLDSTDSKLCCWHPHQVRNRMDLEKFYQWLAQKLVCFSPLVLDSIWNQKEIIGIKRKTKIPVFVVHQVIARNMVNFGQNLVIIGTWNFYNWDESVLTLNSLCNSRKIRA